jgi:hypothetical protein
MPRAEQSKAASIISFFRSAPMETASIVLDLCKDEVRGRQQKSVQAKARATAAAAAAPSPKKASAKKSHKKKVPAGPAVVTSPEGGEVEAGVHEAADLPAGA